MTKKRNFKCEQCLIALHAFFKERMHAVKNKELGGKIKKVKNIIN